jgi:hypothetical protein
VAAGVRLQLVCRHSWCYQASMNMRSTRPLFLAALVSSLTLATGALATAAPHATHASATRAWKASVIAPAQFDLSLAEVRFGRPARGTSAKPARSVSSIRIALRGSTGLDYVAAAVPRSGVLRGSRALVLVVNRRPRGSLAPDLARIGLTVTAARRLGAAFVSQVSDPFTRVRIGLTPALCDLPTRGASLVAGDIRAVLSRGVALTGFSAQAAIAQAYDVVCRRPFEQAFRQAVSPAPAPTCETATANIGFCCPPNAICAPPPCPPCPCGSIPCAAPLRTGRPAVIACPLQAPPIACPL